MNPHGSIPFVYDQSSSNPVKPGQTRSTKRNDEVELKDRDKTMSKPSDGSFRTVTLSSPSSYEQAHTVSSNFSHLQVSQQAEYSASQGKRPEILKASRKPPIKARSTIPSWPVRADAGVLDLMGTSTSEPRAAKSGPPGSGPNAERTGWSPHFLSRWEYRNMSSEIETQAWRRIHSHDGKQPQGPIIEQGTVQNDLTDRWERETQFHRVTGGVEQHDRCPTAIKHLEGTIKVPPYTSARQQPPHHPDHVYRIDLPQRAATAAGSKFRFLQRVKSKGKSMLFKENGVGRSMSTIDKSSISHPIPTLFTNGHMQHHGELHPDLNAIPIEAARKLHGIQQGNNRFNGPVDDDIGSIGIMRCSGFVNGPANLDAASRKTMKRDRPVKSRHDGFLSVTPGKTMISPVVPDGPLKVPSTIKRKPLPTATQTCVISSTQDKVKPPPTQTTVLRDDDDMTFGTIIDAANGRFLSSEFTIVPTQLNDEQYASMHPKVETNYSLPPLRPVSPIRLSYVPGLSDRLYVAGNPLGLSGTLPYDEGLPVCLRIGRPKQAAAGESSAKGDQYKADFKKATKHANRHVVQHHYRVHKPKPKVRINLARARLQAKTKQDKRMQAREQLLHAIGRATTRRAKVIQVPKLSVPIEILARPRRQKSNARPPTPTKSSLNDKVMIDTFVHDGHTSFVATRRESLDLVTPHRTRLDARQSDSLEGTDEAIELEMRLMRLKLRESQYDGRWI